MNERIEENPEVKNSREKTPVSKEREPFQEKLVSSENRETQVLPVANTKRKDTKNTKPALYFEIHNESIICTEKPKGVLGDADKASWINFYYDDEMEDLRNKLPQIKNGFDSTVLWKIGNFYCFHVTKVHLHAIINGYRYANFLRARRGDSYRVEFAKTIRNRSHRRGCQNRPIDVAQNIIIIFIVYTNKLVNGVSGTILFVKKYCHIFLLESKLFYRESDLYSDIYTENKLNYLSC